MVHTQRDEVSKLATGEPRQIDRVVRIPQQIEGGLGELIGSVPAVGGRYRKPHHHGHTLAVGDSRKIADRDADDIQSVSPPFSGPTPAWAF